MRVLLVDDDQSIRSLLARYMQRAGIEHVCAGSAAEALTQFNQAPFDLVISDLDMPGMSGLTLARHLRILDPQIKLFAFSGSSGSMMMQEARHVFDQIFEKPTQISLLIQAARKHGGNTADTAAP